LTEELLLIFCPVLLLRFLPCGTKEFLDLALEWEADCDGNLKDDDLVLPFLCDFEYDFDSESSVVAEAESL